MSLIWSILQELLSYLQEQLDYTEIVEQYQKALSARIIHEQDTVADFVETTFLERHLLKLRYSLWFITPNIDDIIVLVGLASSFSPSLSSCFFLSPRIRLLCQP